MVALHTGVHGAQVVSFFFVQVILRLSEHAVDVIIGVQKECIAEHDNRVLSFLFVDGPVPFELSLRFVN